MATADSTHPNANVIGGGNPNFSASRAAVFSTAKVADRDAQTQAKLLFKVGSPVSKPSGRFA